MKLQLPEPGQIVRVRQRTYLVEDCIPSSQNDDSSRVMLSCVDDDAQGDPLTVLWEHEIDADILEQEDWGHVSRKGFDDPRWFAAYFNTIRWNCATSTDPNLFQAPFRAGIKIEAYQLEPLKKALHLPRVNLFIADDVGLGKTIEAGLIVRELLLRKRVRDIVVACPPSMLYQWKDELETRFGLSFIIIDRDYMMRIRRERGFGVNPWDTHTRFLISHRLLIDESYTSSLRDWLGGMRPGSLLILDEAHHAAPSSGQRYAIDSKITRSIREIAPCFEHRLFLSATPHNGHSNSFSALLEILDPQRFIRGISPDKTNMRDVMIRRLKDDIRDMVGGFPKRNVLQHPLGGLPENSPELLLASLLEQYRNLRTERLKSEPSKKRAAAELLTIGLQKRLLSSVEAFARTLRVHRKTVNRQWEESQNDLSKQKSFANDRLIGEFGLVADSVDPDDDLATIPEEELMQTEDAQFEAVTLATFGPVQGDSKQIFNRERTLLEEMSEIAETARFHPDARIGFLNRWIKENLCSDPASVQAEWNEQRIIVFTEYDDTRRYLVDQLKCTIAAPEERIGVYHGPSSPEEREKLKEAFNADPRKNKLRILIATDAAREGLNLQAHCWNLFHFDVPWNPSRMEQRNGRIDRKLQPRQEVFCHYFVYTQRPEDRVLETLVKKTERIRKELGSLSQVIDTRLGDLLKKGIRRERIDSLIEDIETSDTELPNREVVEEELESNRKRRGELKTEIDAIRTQLERSKAHIGFDLDHFQSTISASLELIKAGPLKKIDVEPGLTAFQFPPLDQLSGAGPTWGDTMDSLRAQRGDIKRLYEWRQKAPIRPVVFEDTGKLDESLVQLHLEQRVVQRLLARFIAQGFTQHELSRACLAQANDSIPRVVLLGRLCLYGENAARLHEEIVAITARWIEPDIRKSRLKPYAKDAEKFTLDLLRESILKPNTKKIPSEIKKNLLNHIPRDIEELLAALLERCRANAESAVELLNKRGDREADLMRKILEKQQKHIRDKLEKEDPRIKTGYFKEFEEARRQLEAERRAWKNRLESLDQELDEEPERIRRMFLVKAQRIEPVGLVYLWPVTG